MKQEFIKSQKLEKWLKWMQTIHDQILVLAWDANLFWEVQDIIRANSRINKPNVFYRYLGRSYLSHMLMGLRRQIKPQKDSISFAGLLEDIAENPTELSRRYFESLHLDSESRNIMKVVDGFAQYAGPSNTHVCPQMVKADLDELRKVVKACEDFADRRIAHHDRREPGTVPTFQELDECIKLLGKTYVKYYLLFYNIGIGELVPPFPYGWKSIFGESWLIEEG